MTLRQEKVISTIKRAAGEFIEETAGRESMITTIRADISKDLKNSTIYISVFPEEKEGDALNFLKRKRGDFREYFKTKVKIRILPFFDFKIDAGEKHRQKIDELTRS